MAALRYNDNVMRRLSPRLIIVGSFVFAILLMLYLAHLESPAHEHRLNILRHEFSRISAPLQAFSTGCVSTSKFTIGVMIVCTYRTRASAEAIRAYYDGELRRNHWAYDPKPKLDKIEHVANNFIYIKWPYVATLRCPEEINGDDLYYTFGSRWFD